MEEILDANLIMDDMEDCNMGIMLKMGQIGLRCVVGEPKKRPTMTQVWEELEAALQSVDNTFFLPRQSSLNSQTFLKGMSFSFSFSQTSYEDNSSLNYIHSSHGSISSDLQKFYIDMDSLSFRSSSLRCLETDSVSIDNEEESCVQESV